MTVDFGPGDSIVVYGDNGTGKSTIADALEWYFTGEIELLSHEGRQHAVRYVGGDDSEVTSVEVLTDGALGGKAVFPDERTPESFQAMRRRRSSARRTLADFINKTKTENGKRWSRYSVSTPSRICEDLQRAKRAPEGIKAADDQVQQYRRALASGNEAVTHDTVLSNLQQICEGLGSIRRILSIRRSTRPGSQPP
jgi:energy-coupling factor transporter ATP-binding protein EcfA2